MGYDPSELNDQFDQVEESDAFEAGEITETKEITALEAYGQNPPTDYDPKRKVLEVTVGTDDDVTFTEYFPLPEGKLSTMNPELKLRKYRQKYGRVPEEGHTVELRKDENGFLTVDLEGQPENQAGLGDY